MLCSWCYLPSDEYELVLVIDGGTLRSPVWVCADEDACFRRQDDWDRKHGLKPRRHTKFISVTATTPAGELVL